MDSEPAEAPEGVRYLMYSWEEKDQKLTKVQKQLQRTTHQMHDALWV